MRLRSAYCVLRKALSEARKGFPQLADKGPFSPCRDEMGREQVRTAQIRGASEPKLKARWLLWVRTYVKSNKHTHEASLLALVDGTTGLLRAPLCARSIRNLGTAE